MEVLHSIWLFIQNQILGMKWLNDVIGNGLNALGVDIVSRWGGSMQFFIYNMIKIMVLLCVLILIISYIQRYFPLMSIFGWKVAVVYVVLGLMIAVVGGTLIEKLHLENQVEEYIRNGRATDVPREKLNFKDRIQYAWEQMGSTAKKVAPYVLIGVGIGAFIHNWIPEEWIVKLLGTDNLFGVIIAAIAGVPMYADIFGTIPVAEALLAKGAQLGVVLSFMMAVTTLSVPSVIMLRKAVKPRLLGIFATICTMGIILVGYFFNAIQDNRFLECLSMFFLWRKTILCALRSTSQRTALLI